MSLSLLLGYCMAMFIGAYLAGWAPTALAGSAGSRAAILTRQIAVFGAGLLVGTALVVIIPEGVAMYYEAAAAAAAAAEPAAPAAANAVDSAISSLGVSVSHAGHAHGRVLAAADANAHSSEANDSPSHTSHSHGGGAIGASLVIGFAFQLLVDHFAGGLHAHQGHTHGSSSGSSVLSSVTLTDVDASCDDVDEEDGEAVPSAANGGRGLSRQRRVGGIDEPSSVGAAASSSAVAAAAAGAAEAAASASTGAGPSVCDAGGAGASAGDATALLTGNTSIASGGAGSSSVAAGSGGSGGVAAGATVGLIGGGPKGSSAFIGLVVHAAVDGVALGAAVAEGDASLGFIVFLAIMLHKAPSSFGLASYLLHQRNSVAQVRARLAFFSCSAPAAALATYAVLSADLFSYTRYGLAMCLLFSGGTFLYVATAHILPEIQAGGHTAQLPAAAPQRRIRGRQNVRLLLPGGDELAPGTGLVAAVQPPSAPPSESSPPAPALRLVRSHLAAAPPSQQGMSSGDVAILCAGLLLPLLLNVQHGH